MTITESPHEAPGNPELLSVETILAALVDIAFRDGRHELLRANGQRGVVKLDINLVLGDHGRPLESTAALTFTAKRHIKDGFSARERTTDG